MFDSVMEKYGDDLGGLKSRFEASGLGQKIQSWIGTGDNEPISREEIKQGLGQDEIDRIAQKKGITPDEAADKLSRELPRAIDEATPNGQIPSPAELHRVSSPTR